MLHHTAAYKRAGADLQAGVVAGEDFADWQPLTARIKEWAKAWFVILDAALREYQQFCRLG
jgi:hypothetical protein